MESLSIEIKAEPLVTETVQRLVSALDPTLYYHSPDHTKDVLRQSMELAREDALDSRDVLLLAIAAAFHDAGFLEQRPKNEPIGAQMAVQAMAGSGRFTETEQQLVADDSRYPVGDGGAGADLQFSAIPLVTGC